MTPRSFGLVAVLALAAAPLSAQDTQEEYERGCDGGDLLACSVLGLIYETGAGGERDMERAVELYDRACARDVAPACRRREFASGTEPTVPVDELVRVGYVADAYDGAPLGGAIVRVRGPGLGDRRYVSDAAGRVVLDPLPRGRHDIAVQRGGYALMEGRIPVPWDTDFLILMERVAEVPEETTGQLFGQVFEEETGTAIPAVDIFVTGSGTARILSNPQGRFYLAAVEPGEVEVRFERLGFEPRTVRVDVEEGRTVEIYATMSARAIELEPIEVTVASRYLQRSGFYRRAQSTVGEHFTFRDIEALNPMLVGDILRRVPGVRVVSEPLGVGAEAISGRRPTGIESAECRLRPYFNGVPLADFDIELVPPHEIEALEVYQGANVPIGYIDEFQADGPTCGVVLIWSRDPSRLR
jgi:hypothetical protein